MDIICERAVGLMLHGIFEYDPECDDKFNELISQTHYTFVGSKMYFELDDYRKVELSFCSSKENYSRYHAIRMCLINKTTGKIHESYTIMDELFAAVERDHPSAIIYDGEWYIWDVCPTREDRQILRKHVVDYITTWK